MPSSVLEIHGLPGANHVAPVARHHARLEQPRRQADIGYGYRGWVIGVARKLNSCSSLGPGICAPYVEDD